MISRKQIRPRAVLKAVMAGFSALIMANCMGTSTEEAPNAAAGSWKGEDGQMIVKDVFLRSQDIVLEKGKAVPKGTFILKPDQTEDYYIKSSSGPWEFGGLAKSSATGRHQWVDVRGIEEIRLTAGGSSIGCPSSNHYRVNVDLNRGSGGAYVYLCVAGPLAGSAPVLYVNIDYSSSEATFLNNKATNATQGVYEWYQSNGDMNQGAGGDFIWGKITRRGPTDPCKVIGVGATYKDHWWETSPVPSDWVVADETDLNYNAGGAYIHMILKKSCP